MSRLTFISFLMLLVFVSAPAAIDAKRKTRTYQPPLKITDVTTTPVPFVPGYGPMTIAVTVELPMNVREFDLIEVASFISVPSKRSIRFLVSRQPLTAVFIEDGKPSMQATLFWDGKDQTRRYVSQGTYSYEVRAKLMAHEEGFAKAKVVSRFAKGTLEVSSPHPRDPEPRESGT